MVLPDPGKAMNEDTGAIAARGAESPDGQGAQKAGEGREAGGGEAREATVGPAEAVLEPALLDLYGECDVGLSERCREWVEGGVRCIGEPVAREAERCLGAAEDAWAGALADALDDQLEALGAREGAPHRLSLVNPACPANALQCAGALLGRFYDAPRGRRVLWRARVDPASTAERVRIRIRSRETDSEPVEIEIEAASAAVLIAGERTTSAHAGDAERLRTLGETVAERVRAFVTASRRLCEAST